MTTLEKEDLPKWDKNTFEVIWYTNWWDGPLSGFLERDEIFYFSVLDHLDRDNRSFIIYELTKEDQEECLRRHEEFRRLVGTHCDRGSYRDRAPTYSDEITSETKTKFYDLQRTWKKLDLQSRPIGWFEES